MPQGKGGKRKTTRVGSRNQERGISCQPRQCWLKLNQLRSTPGLMHGNGLPPLAVHTQQRYECLIYARTE